MKSECLFPNIVLTATWLIGWAFFFGVYFGIYYPLIELKDWEYSTCKIAGFRSYETYAIYKHNYILYKVAVEIDGEEYPGYAWESTASRKRITENAQDRAYPYDYFLCDSEYLDRGYWLSEQLLMPRWMCKPMQYGPTYQVGDKVECQWNLYRSSASDPTDPNDVDDFSYPRLNHNWIEVLLQNEDVVYYD